MKAGEGLTGHGGAFTPLLKSFLEEALKGEVEEHLRSNEEPNRKNGKTRKTVGKATKRGRLHKYKASPTLK